MKQKVKITNNDSNPATIQRLLQQLEKTLLTDHSGCRFAMTPSLRGAVVPRHYEEKTTDEAIPSSPLGSPHDTPRILAQIPSQTFGNTGRNGRNHRFLQKTLISAKTSLTGITNCFV